MSAKPTPSPSRKRAGSRKKLPEMVRRQHAVVATLAKYRARAFDWKAKATCLHMTWFHLRRMGRRPPALPQIGSLLAARRELAKRGWDNVGDVLDAIGLERIAPAAMRLGDLAMLEDDTGLGGMVISASAGKVIGWGEDADGMVVLLPLEIAAAWRV